MLISFDPDQVPRSSHVYGGAQIDVELTSSPEFEGIISNFSRKPRMSYGLKKYVKSFYADGKTSSNGCAHAAVVTCLNAFGKLPSWSNPVAHVYSRSPPDTKNALGNFGTTPGHLANICILYGLKPVRFDQRGGQSAAQSKLWAALRAEKLVIVLVDNGWLGKDTGQADSSFGAHWVVAHGYDERSIYLANRIGHDLPSEHDVSKQNFEQAWTPWFLPLDEFKCAGVIVSK